MIRGQSTELAPADQVVVARWFVKTTTMTEYRHRPRDDANSVPLPWLSGDEGVPPVLWVLLGARTAQGSFAESDYTQLRLPSPRPPDHVDGAIVTLAIGHLVLQMFKPPLPWQGDIRIPEPSRDFVIQLWPHGGLLESWPPAAVLGQEDMVELRSSFVPTSPS